MDEEVFRKAQALYKEAFEEAKPCRWFDVNDCECEIKFMTGNTRYAWSLLCCGLKETLLKKERGIIEKPSVRSNCKSYYKLFYLNGRLIKVEEYQERLLRYYLCYYRNSVRVLMPFDTMKKNEWWHYCIVTQFSEYGAGREIWIDNIGQIIYSEYTFTENGAEYEYANCLLNAQGNERINHFERGIFYRDGSYERKE